MKPKNDKLKIKRCCHCGCVKSIDDFALNNGYLSVCRECINKELALKDKFVKYNDVQLY